MSSVYLAALVCVCLARSSAAAAEHLLRAHAYAPHTINKDLTSTLAAIDERLRMLDTISAMQLKQGRRLEVIQNKLDRVETTLSLKLERAQLAIEKLEYRLNMLQNSVETSVEVSATKLERNQAKVAEIAKNLTTRVDTHRHLLEKVSDSYADAWRRGLILESLARDSMSLINATRREFADRLQALARRQRDTRVTSAELEAAFSRSMRLNDNSLNIEQKMKEMLEVQKRFVDSCQRMQLDAPATAVFDLFNSLVNKTALIFHEVQKIKNAVSKHDMQVTKTLSGRLQSEAPCHRLEKAFRNASHSNIKELELHQLTEKFVALTNRADAALQQLERRVRVRDEAERRERDEAATHSDVAAGAGEVLKLLTGSSEDNDNFEEDEEYPGYYDDGDMMEEDRQLLGGAARTTKSELVTRAPHRRHQHKHPYDRGPG